jgi:hypothetical protein
MEICAVLCCAVLCCCREACVGGRLDLFPDLKLRPMQSTCAGPCWSLTLCNIECFGVLEISQSFRTGRIGGDK